MEKLKTYYTSAKEYALTAHNIAHEAMKNYFMPVVEKYPLAFFTVLLILIVT